MHKQDTEKLLTPKILTQAAKLYSIDPVSVSFVGGFENIIYQGLRKGEPVIIRFTHNDHRTAELVYSELHWLQFLKVNGGDVCSAYPSDAGNLVETIVIQTIPIHISVFEKAPGKMININQERDNITLFKAWGRATGKLHRLTQSYVRPPEVVRREDNVDIFEKVLAPFIPNEPELKGRIANTISQLRALPQTHPWYGLMHSDIHLHNFFYDGEGLHIFDFDDCCYYQLASDIAMPLYYACWGINLETQAQVNEFGHSLALHFLKGYLQEHPLSKEQLLTLPLLLKFRDCELLAVLIDEFGPTPNEKEAALLNSFQTRILQDRPIVNLDWEKIAQEIGIDPSK